MDVISSPYVCAQEPRRGCRRLLHFLQAIPVPVTVTAAAVALLGMFMLMEGICVSGGMTLACV